MAVSNKLVFSPNIFLTDGNLSPVFDSLVYESDVYLTNFSGSDTHDGGGDDSKPKFYLPIYENMNVEHDLLLRLILLAL